MGKEYVVHHGEVTEVKKCSQNYNKRITYTTVGGTTLSGAHADYKCDKNGKSLNTGKYHNFKDIFFPWVHGIFDEEKLKLNPICDCKD